MIDSKDLLSEAVVQRKAEVFLLKKYPGSKVAFNNAQLVAKKDALMYELGGTINLKSHSTMERFICCPNPNRYSLKVAVDAKQGAILNYELR